MVKNGVLWATTRNKNTFQHAGLLTASVSTDGKPLDGRVLSAKMIRQEKWMKVVPLTLYAVPALFPF